MVAVTESNRTTAMDGCAAFDPCACLASNRIHFFAAMTDAVYNDAVRDGFTDTNYKLQCAYTSRVNVSTRTLFKMTYAFHMVSFNERLGPASDVVAYPPATRDACKAMQSAMLDYVIDIMLVFDTADDYCGEMCLIAAVDPASENGVATVHVYRKQYRL